MGGGDLVSGPGCRGGVDGLVALDGVPRRWGVPSLRTASGLILKVTVCTPSTVCALYSSDVVLVHVRLAAEVSVEAAGEGGVDCRLNVQVTGGVAVGVEMLKLGPMPSALSRSSPLS